MRSGTSSGGFGGGAESDRRGKSEVIGALLLVALVILVAAAAGEFVFGLGIVTGGERAVGPKVVFGTEVDDGGNLTIEHLGGDAVANETITILESESGTAQYDVGAEWTSGETVTLESDDLEKGETIRIVWEAEETDESTVLLEYDYGG